MLGVVVANAKDINLRAVKKWNPPMKAVNAVLQDPNPFGDPFFNPYCLYDYL
jgi:hypothetical protein